MKAIPLSAYSAEVHLIDRYSPFRKGNFLFRKRNSKRKELPDNGMMHYV